MKKLFFTLVVAYACSTLSMEPGSKSLVPFQQNSPICTVPDDVFFNHVVLENLCNIDDPMQSINAINALCQTNKRFNKLLEKNKNSLIVSFYNPLLMGRMEPLSRESKEYNIKKLIPYLISKEGFDPAKRYNSDRSFLESCLHTIFEDQSKDATERTCEDVLKTIYASRAFRKSIKSMPFQKNNQELSRIFKMFIKGIYNKSDLFLGLERTSSLFLKKGCDPTLSTAEDESVFKYALKNMYFNNIHFLCLLSQYSDAQSISREIHKTLCDISQSKVDPYVFMFNMCFVLRRLSDQKKVNPMFIHESGDSLLEAAAKTLLFNTYYDKDIFNTLLKEVNPEEKSVAVLKALKILLNKNPVMYCRTLRFMPKLTTLSLLSMLWTNPICKWTSISTISGGVLVGALKLWQRWR